MLFSREENLFREENPKNRMKEVWSRIECVGTTSKDGFIQQYLYPWHDKFLWPHELLAKFDKKLMSTTIEDTPIKSQLILSL